MAGGAGGAMVLKAMVLKAMVASRAGATAPHGTTDCSCASSRAARAQLEPVFVIARHRTAEQQQQLQRVALRRSTCISSVRGGRTKRAACELRRKKVLLTSCNLPDINCLRQNGVRSCTCNTLELIPFWCRPRSRRARRRAAGKRDRRRVLHGLRRPPRYQRARALRRSPPRAAGARSGRTASRARGMREALRESLEEKGILVGGEVGYNGTRGGQHTDAPRA